MTANITLMYFSDLGLVSTLWPTTPGTVAGQSGQAGPHAPEHADLGWPSGVGPATVRGKYFLDLNDMAYPDVVEDLNQQCTSPQIYTINNSKSGGNYTYHPQ
jgi:hypothetical protein